MLGKDQLSIFIDYNGSPARNHMLTWSDVPSALGYEFPYVIGLCSRYGPGVVDPVEGVPREEGGVWYGEGRRECCCSPCFFAGVICD